MLARLPETEARGLLARESQWENVVASLRASQADALTACSDYNRRLNELPDDRN